MNSKLLFLLSIIFLSSCSFFSRSNNGSGDSNALLQNSKKRFKLTDKAGEFVVYKEIGYKKSNKTYISKRQVLPFNDDKSKILEQSVTISEVGLLGKNLKIMRPFKSQYSVWFDGKKYVSSMSLDKNNQSLVVNLKSPEEQWNGIRNVKFPDTRSVYCFFSQVLECSAITGFFTNAIKKGKGQMGLYIIWDGYPYFQEQYLNVPDEVFSRAKFNLDGTNKNGEKRFSLSFGEQVIFFLMDKNDKFVKQFWISQGMTMVLSDI